MAGQGGARNGEACQDGQAHQAPSQRMLMTAAQRAASAEKHSCGVNPRGVNPGTPMTDFRRRAGSEDVNILLNRCGILF